jgi:hypothetical protein
MKAVQRLIRGVDFERNGRNQSWLLAFDFASCALLDIRMDEERAPGVAPIAVA